MRGLDTYEEWRRYFLTHPGAYAASVRRSVHATSEGLRLPTDVRVDSAVEHVYDHVPISFGRTDQRILGLFMYGLAHAADYSRMGRTAEADDMVNRLMVFGEQAVLDGGSLDHAWLLTFLPQPQWSRFPRPQFGKGGGRGGKGKNNAAQDLQQDTLPTLAEPRLVTAAMGYVRDLADHKEARKKLRGKAGAAPEEEPG